MDVIRILKDGRTILKIVGDKKNPEVNIIETIVIKPKRNVEMVNAFKGRGFLVPCLFIFKLQLSLSRSYLHRYHLLPRTPLRLS